MSKKGLFLTFFQCFLGLSILIEFLESKKFFLSLGACKLARTSTIIKKKKKNFFIKLWKAFVPRL